MDVSVNAPPQAGQPGPRTVDPTTGAVEGTVGITDPAGDPLTYTVGPVSNGRVFIATDGTYRFTPTLAARLRANLTPEVEVATFTVTASDGQFSTTRTISVPIDAAQATITDSFYVGHHPESVTIGPGGWAYIGNRESGTVSVIDAITHEVVGEYTGRGEPVDVAAAQHGGRLFVLDKFNQELVSIDTTTGLSAPTTTFVGPGARDVAVSPDGKRVYVTTLGSAQEPGRVIVVDAETRNVLANIELGDFPSGGIAVSPDNTRVYVAGVDNSQGVVHVIDAETNTKIDSIAVDANPYGLALSRDGRKLFVANLNGEPTGGGVKVIDLATKAVSSVSTVTSATGVAVSADGSVVFAIRYGNHRDGQIWAIDTASNTVIAPIAGLPDYGQTYEDIAISPDGSFLYLIDSNRAPDGAVGANGSVHVISIGSTDLPPV